MNIELKNIKHFKSLSEDTCAFWANIYVDGRKVGYLENTGKGEGNYPQMVKKEVLDAMNSWITSQPPVKSQYGELSMTMDLYFSKLVSNHLAMTNAKRMFASHVCYACPDGSVVRSKRLGKDTVSRVHAGEINAHSSEGLRMIKSVEELYRLICA